MTDDEKTEIEALYGCNDPIDCYMIDFGAKIGNTKKTNLEDCSVEDLEK